MYESANPSAIRSQQEITGALLSLMQKHPYNEITVKEILIDTKLARKTFYRNFDSKDDVLRSHIRSILLDYFDIVNNARGDALTTIFAFADRNKKLLLLLDKNDMLHLVLKCMNDFSSTIMKNQDPDLNPFVKLFDGLDSDYLVALNIGAIWNVIALWIRHGMKESPEEIKVTVAQYLSRIKPV